MVQGSAGKATRRVEIGDEIDGWRVKALMTNSVVLDRGSRSKTLELERKGDPGLTARAKAATNRRRVRPRARGAVPARSGSPPSASPSTPNNDGGKSQVSDDNEN